MTIKELHKLLNKIIKIYPDCEDLPIRLVLPDHNAITISELDIIHNYWLDGIDMSTTGSSGYEVSGELRLIGI